MAYGVAQQAILFPHETGSWELLPKVFFRPYFQVYGELFIEDNVYSGDLMNFSSTNRHVIKQTKQRGLHSMCVFR